MEVKDSILNTLKDGYDPARYWPERTKNNLADDSESYHRDAVATEGTKEIFAKFLPYLSKEKHDYVDIGCGYGLWVDAIKTDPNFKSYFGVDLVPERIEKAKELHPDEQFVWGDIAVIDNSEVLANVVFFNNVLQHLPLNQKWKAIQLAKRVLYGTYEKNIILMREGRFMDAPLDECENYYIEDCPAHMIPTPLPLLRKCLRPWKLEKIGDCLFVARREACQ